MQWYISFTFLRNFDTCIVAQMLMNVLNTLTTAVRIVQIPWVATSVGATMDILWTMINAHAMVCLECSLNGRESFFLQISMNVRLQQHATPMPHVATLRDHTIVPVCMVTLEMDSTAQVNCTFGLVFIGCHF